jgi:Xaa-Pro aminopeptidase
MQTKGLDAFILTHGDPHVSEYLAPCDERIAFISGFTGTNGLCVVTQGGATEHALCWTDGRYYLQCEKQLTEGWSMMKLEPSVPKFGEWLRANMPKGSKVGVWEAQLPYSQFNAT